MTKHFMKKALAVSASFALLVLPISPILAASSTFDFGDAPDGKLTGYTGGGATTGAFPSLLASDGARTADAATAWLGDKANTEADSKQVDADRFDDGVAVKLSSCATSSASLLVHVTKPGTTSGTAYLNMFFDWDKDGDWGGTDSCGADEWAVRNFVVDVGSQTTDMAVYVPSFKAGKNVKNIWYRAVVTLDERMLSETGTGSYAKGEVEDYGPAPRAGKKFGAYCKPNPLILFHGAAGAFEIKPKPGSVPITSVGLTSNVNPGGKARSISRIGPRTFRYKSKKVDKPNRIVRETVPVRVRFGTTASIVVECKVAVIHFTPRVPQQQNVHDYTTTRITGTYTVTRSGNSTILRAGLDTIDTEMLQLSLTGIDLPLNAQSPPLPRPTNANLDINGGGWPSDWNCEMLDSTKRCRGSSTRIQGRSVFEFWFDELFDPPSSLHLHLLDADGKVVAAADLPYQGTTTTSPPTPQLPSTVPTIEPNVDTSLPPPSNQYTH